MGRCTVIDTLYFYVVTICDKPYIIAVAAVPPVRHPGGNSDCDHGVGVSAVAFAVRSIDADIPIAPVRLVPGAGSAFVADNRESIYDIGPTG